MEEKQAIPERAKVIEKYDLDFDNIKIEVNVVDDETSFAKRYFLNFPSYGPGTMALLNNLRASVLSETSIRAEKQIGAKFVEKTLTRYRRQISSILK